MSSLPPTEGVTTPPLPYFEDERVSLYHGDFREILPKLGIRADLIIADPPYGETSLEWDRWPDHWPSVAAPFGKAMWCFGSMRMFLEHREEFTGWQFSQDVIWEKHNGSNLANDRFNRVHESALFWYQGSWGDRYHVPPTTASAVKRTVRKKARPAQWIGATGENMYTSEDGGPLLMASVIFARSMHGRAINETEKPTEILEPLIEYGCRPGGLVIDLFSGSAAALVAARATGRYAIGFEVRESQCEKAANRLAQGHLDFGEATA